MCYNCTNALLHSSKEEYLKNKEEFVKQYRNLSSLTLNGLEYHCKKAYEVISNPFLML